MAAKTYLIQNSAMQTTAAPVKQPTGTAIRTMMQLIPQSSPASPIRIIEWGCSFDGSAAATPGEIELIDCGTVFATMSSCYQIADIMPFSDPNAPAQSANASTGVPFELNTTSAGAALSGWATAAVTEGSITTVRTLDAQLIAPTTQYVKQFPLGREPEIKGGNGIRVRMTFGTTVNAYIYLIAES